MGTLESGLYDLGRLDRLSSLDTPAHRLDPRAKVLTTMVYLVCVVSFGTYELLPMLPFLLFPVAMISAGGLPGGFLMRKLAAVAPFALLVGAFNPLLDQTVITEVAGIGITGGWVSFTSIMLRFLLTTLAALVLVATTGMAGVCAGLQRLGLPDVLSTQLLLLYRYLFVLGEEVMRMARARSLRAVGQRGMGMGVYVSMLGNLLLRTYARADRLYRAMLARGFTGNVRTVSTPRFTARDAVFVAGWSAAFVTMRAIDVPTLLGTLVTGVIG